MRDYEERKRPYAPNLAGRLLTGCPDLVAKLDVGDRRFLADTAAVAMP
jgi:hypothetical protein